jgi:hypothetical protein
MSEAPILRVATIRTLSYPPVEARNYPGAKLAPVALAEVFDQHQIAALMVDLRPENVVAVRGDGES